MKKLGTLFVLAVVFLTFSAQNCKSHDPYTIPGTAGNPSAVGSPQGSIEATVFLGGSNGNRVKNAFVYIAISDDSLFSGIANNDRSKYKYLVTDDSGSVQFSNLIIGKRYSMTASYTSGGTTFHTAFTTNATYKANPINNDSSVTAGTLNFPAIATFTVQ